MSKQFTLSHIRRRIKEIKNLKVSCDMNWRRSLLMQYKSAEYQCLVLGVIVDINKIDKEFFKYCVACGCQLI